MDKTRKMILIGEGLLAGITYEYFMYDSLYEVVAFADEQNYIKLDSLFGLPIQNVVFDTQQSTGSYWIGYSE